MPDVSLLKGRKLWKKLFDLHFEMLLHSFYSPKSSSEYDIFANAIKAIHMYFIEYTQKSIGKIKFLIFIIPKKDPKFNFIRYKLQSHLFYCNSYRIATRPNHTMRISDLIELLLCYGLQWFHGNLFIQDIYLIP